MKGAPEVECILHIGSHKTGTSALQQLLYDRSAAEALGGVIYPKSCIGPFDRSHNGFGARMWADFSTFGDHEVFEGIVDNLLDEVRSAERFIISSELLEKTAMAEPQRGRLRLFLARIADAGFQIRVVYTLRRQDSLVTSIFKQWVRDYNTRYCGDAFGMADREFSHLRYATIASAWLSLGFLAGMTVVPYIEHDHYATMSGVLDAMSLPLLTPDDVVIANKSLDGEYLRFVHHLNRYGMDRTTHDTIVDACFRASEWTAPGRLTLFDATERAEYLSRFEDDDRRLLMEHGFDWAGVAQQSADEDVFAPLDFITMLDVLYELDMKDADIVTRACRQLFRSGPGSFGRQAVPIRMAS